MTMLNHRNKPKSSGKFGTIFTCLFCIGLLVFIFIGIVPSIVAGVYGVISVITFIVYAIDKSSAQNGRWRTKESTLHALSLLGGWPGAYFAQKKLRHKSSKEAFKRVYWITVFLNVFGLCLLGTEKRSYFLNHIIIPLLNG